MSSSMAKVGYWWSEKKSQKIAIQELENFFREKGYELVKIDLDAPLEEQGPFDAMIHKLSDVVVKAEAGDERAQSQVQRVEHYMDMNPELIILDPLCNVRKLLDRYKQYKLIVDSELAREGLVFTPTFVEFTTTDVKENLEKMKNANVQFPFVCKPSIAHGSSYAHQMSLIFNESGLAAITPPCVAQTFINHNARLFKLFLIKNNYFVIERPSLKNFKAGDYETVYFDSHDISKPNSSSALTELDAKDQINIKVHEPEKERLDRIVNVVANKLGLSLLGIDVIIENVTGRYAIIDMNAFPGYDGVDDFLKMLTDVVVEEIEESKKQRILTSIDSKRLEPTSGIPEELESESLHDDGHTHSTPNVNLSAQTENTNNEPTCASPGAHPECVKQSTHGSKTVIDKVNCVNDIDSGIDTSDSCDEKKIKKQAQVKTVRRQHSRSFTSNSCLKTGDNYNSI